MLDVTEVYRPDPRAFELRPFQDRVLELVRLFHDAPAVRLLVVGTITAGAPIEAVADAGEAIDVRGPTHGVRRHPAWPQLRQHLCPALDRVSNDAFEIARLITPILAGLRVSGTVPLDLDPWLFAGIALMIARMGVAAFCAEDDASGGVESQPATPAAPVPPPVSLAQRRAKAHRRRKK